MRLAARNSGHPGGGQGVPLGQTPRGDQIDHLRGGVDGAHRGRTASARVLLPDVDHARRAPVIKVRETGCPGGTAGHRYLLTTVTG